MPDNIVPFVVVSGLAVGVTATTVITDSATLPIAVSSFNGLTGDVIGVSSVKGMTGTVILPGLNLYLYSIGII
jgi:hypothetical protein